MRDTEACASSAQVGAWRTRWALTVILLIAEI